LKDLLSVGAEVDTVEVIPLERCEENRAFWWVVLEYLNIIGQELALV
jgi:hypothetical protein